MHIYIYIYMCIHIYAHRACAVIFVASEEMGMFRNRLTQNLTTPGSFCQMEKGLRHSNFETFPYGLWSINMNFFRKRVTIYTNSPDLDGIGCKLDPTRRRHAQTMNRSNIMVSLQSNLKVSGTYEDHASLWFSHIFFCLGLTPACCQGAVG